MIIKITKQKINFQKNDLFSVKNIIVIYDISAKSGILFCEKGSLRHDADGGVSRPFELRNNS